MTKPVITAFDWVPWFAQGLVRDLRVRWALEEVGQDYDVRYLPQGSQKEPPHRALQPFGQVPTYEQDGLTLFESGAIVLHIAESHGGLLPGDAGGRARAIEWMFAALNTVEPPISDYAIATLFESDEPWSKPRLPSIMARIAERLDELSRRLGESEWLDGELFGRRPADDRGAAPAEAHADGDGARQSRRLCRARRGAAGLPARAGRAVAGFTGKPPPEYAFLDQPPAKQGESK